MSERDLGRPTIVGTPPAVRDIVADYIEAGVDELIVPDFTFGPMDRKLASMDLFIGEVAPHFRQG
jgi:alkanesulfonate monooxygenase SsuD/methylene tetrahydromethanopterin reductase-like flavin-dependent oxidoreductase (luciferase family)